MDAPRDIPGGRTRAHFRGCLLGGAVGDALGAAVEFDSLSAIRSRFGPEGLRDFAPYAGRLGAITDDTQMTLFTAEALLRLEHLHLRERSDRLAGFGWRAYLRWLDTQGDGPRRRAARDDDGWLIRQRELHASRGPGNTCLTSLREGRPGTPESPVNDSKGCGGVMRVAPAGFVAADPFRAASELAALTHGHPTGWLSAGYLALLVHEVAGGATIDEGALRALVELRRHPGHEETSAAVERALALSRSPRAPALDVEALGAGWVAEEALAIGLFAALTAADFEAGVLLAVNHSGDSDSTGAIAGSLLGAAMGESAIPRRWIDRLELREVIERVADDLHRHHGAGSPPCPGEGSGCWSRYPPR